MIHLRLLRGVAVTVAAALALVGGAALPAQAASPGHIKGVITAPAGTDLARFWVSAETTSGNVIASDHVSGSGAYDIRVHSGSYRLEFTYDAVGSERPTVNPFYRGNTRTLGESARVVVHSGKTTRLSSVAIPAGAEISGTVTLGAPLPWRAPEVTLYDAEGAVIATRGTTLDGAFAFQGLRAGTYRLGFAARDHFTTFWPSAESLNDADAISVTAGQVQDADITLPAHPLISGTVTIPASPVVDIRTVHVELTDEHGDQVQPLSTADVTSDGTYSLRAAPGDYRVKFTAGNGKLAQLWAGNAYFPSQADVVTVSRGHDAAGVDASLIAGGTVIGYVDAPKDGTAMVFDIRLWSQRDDDVWESVARTRYSYQSGVPWTFAGRRPGNYVVQYIDVSLEAAYQDAFGSTAAQTPETAVPVPVTAGTTKGDQYPTLTERVNKPLTRDLDGDGNSDIVMRRSSGAVYVAYGDGDGGIRQTELLSTTYPSSWRFFWGGDISVGDAADIMAVDPKGRLWRFGDLKSGKIAPEHHSGGFQNLSRVFGAGDVTGDGRTDILGRDSSGYLWTCAVHDDATCWSQTRRSAPTFHGATALFSPGDFDGDGLADIITRDGTGVLKLFSGNGHDAFLGAGVPIAGSWKSSSIFSVGDFDGDELSDLLARDPAGKLWLYPGDGDGQVGAPILVTTGWGSYTAVP